MCVWVVVQLPRRLKSMFFENVSSLHCTVLYEAAPFEKKFKIVDFSLWGKQCIVSSNCIFLQIFFCEKWFHYFLHFFADFIALCQIESYPNKLLFSFFTDGANNARQFFSEKNREKVLDLFNVDDEDRAKIQRILRDINVIGRIANSTRKIDIPKFKKFCTDAYLFKVQAFTWPSLTVSLHRG